MSMMNIALFCSCIDLPLRETETNCSFSVALVAMFI